MTHERAGQPAKPSDLVDVARLVTSYYALHPDPGEVGQRVAFGTSGHRGSSLNVAFNEDHILATSQAIVEYRAAQGVDGPLFLGADSHALSEPGPGLGAGGLRGQRGDGHDRQPGRLHPDPGGLARDPGLQPGALRRGGPTAWW